MTPFREAIEQMRANYAALGSRGSVAKVLEAVEMLEGDELDVIGFVLERVQLGHARYGSLCLGTDGRDWGRERDEEIADGLVYEACRVLAAGRGGR